jgi:predicted ArsR family transcriptional regulator
MIRRELDNEGPDRLYTVTRGRSQADEPDLDLVTLIVSNADPVPGMQSEHARILRLCTSPAAVVEISADLGLPVGVVKILLSDLLRDGKITARHPRLSSSGGRAQTQLPDAAILKKVLVGLHNL